MHQQPRKRVAIEHDDKDLLHGLKFDIFVALFQRVSQWLNVSRLVRYIVLMNNCPARWSGSGHLDNTNHTDSHSSWWTRCLVVRQEGAAVKNKGGKPCFKPGTYATFKLLYTGRNPTWATTMAAATPSDPIFKPLQSISAEPSSWNAPTIALLHSAFSDGSTVQQIYSQKLEHRPLPLNSTALNQQDSRRLKRLAKLHRKRTPKTLSSKDKRRLHIYDLRKVDIK